MNDLDARVSRVLGTELRPYSTSWADGGPLVDQFDMDFRRHHDGEIEASSGGEGGFGATRLVAACNLVLALVENGKVEAR